MARQPLAERETADAGEKTIVDGTGKGPVYTAILEIGRRRALPTEEMTLDDRGREGHVPAILTLKKESRDREKYYTNSRRNPPTGYELDWGRFTGRLAAHATQTSPDNRGFVDDRRRHPG
ncbi:hypothetical protein GCM10017687_88070 [Streptomyces echinatus]